MNHSARLIVIVGIAVLSLPALAESPRDPAALAERIDEQLAAAWKKANVEPAQPAADHVFLRRVYLDLVGRIPTVAETHAFNDDRAPGKRARLAEQLLASGGYARHQATVWRRAWMPQADTPEFANLIDDFESWLAVRLRDKTPYDRLVQELLTTPRSVVGGRRGPARTGDAVTPAGFLAASQFKPENLAANTTRAFLGLNLDCAQCHNHPFSRWTRDQFWQTAAFFAAPQTAGNVLMAKLEIAIPETTRSVTPVLLDKQALSWPEKLEAETGRKMLANWVTAPQNQFFARNAVNRVWAQLLGTGLVEPLDDLSDDNPPTHPELLAELATAFTDSGFDLHYLTQAIVLTRAYQLSTELPADSPAAEPQHFARMPVRGLTGEQLYDSLRVAAGLPLERRDAAPSRFGDQRERFAARMLIGKAVDAERSIVQALALLNGELTAELTTPDTSPALAAAADAPFLNTQEKIETLYFATLSRRPTAAESSRLGNYVESGGSDRTMSAALADIFWTLLNCSEFNTNH